MNQSPQKNTKMEKRLKWINVRDERQTAWLATHLHKIKKSWDNSIPPLIFSEQGESTHVKYTVAFIKEAQYWLETASTREYCRNLKSAWKAWDKRDNNRNKPTFFEGSYSISIQARNELEKLAKSETDDNSFSTVIDTLLLNAKEVKHLQKQLNMKLKNANCGMRINTNFLSTFFSDDKSIEQAKILTQEFEQEIKTQEQEHKSKLQESIKNNDEKTNLLNKEIKQLKEQITTLNDDLDRLLLRE